MILQNYRRTEVEIGMTDFRDLTNVCLRGDNLVAFVDEWDSVIYGMRDPPPENIIETLFVEQVRKCKHFEPVFALYDLKCTHEGQVRSYEAIRS